MILRGGAVYDGSGGVSYVGDVAIRRGTIVAIGDLGSDVGRWELEVTELAMAPGFISVLSWIPRSLLVDGTSQSDIRQGVTLEIFGEASPKGRSTEK